MGSRRLKLNSYKLVNEPSNAVEMKIDLISVERHQFGFSPIQVSVNKGRLQSTVIGQTNEVGDGTKLSTQPTVPPCGPETASWPAGTFVLASELRTITKLINNQ